MTDTDERKFSFADGVPSTLKASRIFFENDMRIQWGHHRREVEVETSRHRLRR